MSEKQHKELEKTGYDLEEMNIILKIPKDAVSLGITASIIKDGNLVEVGRDLSVQDIFECRKSFIDNLVDDDYDATFVITEKGKKYLEELHQDESGI